MGGLCQTEENRECLRGLVLSNISLPDQWEEMTQPHSEGAQKRYYIARDKYTHMCQGHDGYTALNVIVRCCPPEASRTASMLHDIGFKFLEHMIALTLIKLFSDSLCSASFSTYLLRFFLYFFTRLYVSIRRTIMGHAQMHVLMHLCTMDEISKNAVVHQNKSQTAVLTCVYTVGSLCMACTTITPLCQCVHG